MIKQISHIAIAVKSVEQARVFYRSVLGIESSFPVEGAGIRVSMVEFGNAKIELMEPLGREGVIAKFLEKQGEGFHHVCLEVDDINSELALLEAKGIELIDRQPRRGVEGMVAFLHPQATNRVLIELLERKQSSI
jgi:methylmalonyl-CoA epimerase